MTTLTTLDLDQLAIVTGGVCTCTPDSRQPAGPGGPGPGGDPGMQASAPPSGGGGGGNGFLSGLQAFFDFLQSPMFNKLIGGASQIVSAFNTGNGGSTGAPQQDATAEA